MIICVYENGEFHGFLFITIVSSLFREVMQVLYNVFGPHRIWSRNNTAHLLHVHIIFPPKSPGTVISNSESKLGYWFPTSSANSIHFQNVLLFSVLVFFGQAY